MNLLPPSLSILVLLFHGIYISVVEIELHENNATAIVKIFSDDLHDALRDEFSVSITEGQNIDSLSLLYFNKQLQINTQTELLTFGLDSLLTQADSYRVHLTATSSHAIKSGTITASQLMDLFPTQQNILKLNKTDGTKAFHVFRSTDKQKAFEF